MHTHRHNAHFGISGSLLRLLFLLAALMGTPTLLADPGPVSGSGADSITTVPHPKTDASTRKARAGFDALMRLEFDKAEAIFDSLSASHPDYPLNEFLKACLYWARAELAGGAGLGAARTQGIRLFETAVANARSRAKTHLQVPQWRLAEGLGTFFLGRLLVDARETMKGLGLAREGRNKLQALLNEHPHMTDAYFALGMYEYLMGSIPSGMRWLSNIMGYRGNQALGVQYLERAITGAPLLAPEAARMLLVAAAIEPERNRPCRYLVLARDMAARHPANTHFSGAVQLIDVHCGYPERALKENARARERYLKNKPWLAASLNIAELQARRSLGDLAQIEQMQPHFAKHDRAFWYLAKAQALDIGGRRNEALKIYKALVWARDFSEKEEIYGRIPDWVYNAARHYRKQPYARPAPASLKGSQLVIYRP